MVYCPYYDTQKIKRTRALRTRDSVLRFNRSRTRLFPATGREKLPIPFYLPSGHGSHLNGRKGHDHRAVFHLRLRSFVRPFVLSFGLLRRMYSMRGNHSSLRHARRYFLDKTPLQRARKSESKQTVQKGIPVRMPRRGRTYLRRLFRPARPAYRRAGSVYDILRNQSFGGVSAHSPQSVLRPVLYRQRPRAHRALVARARPRRKRSAQRHLLLHLPRQRFLRLFQLAQTGKNGKLTLAEQSGSPIFNQSNPVFYNF